MVEIDETKLLVLYLLVGVAVTLVIVLLIVIISNSGGQRKCGPGTVHDDRMNECVPTSLYSGNSTMVVPKDASLFCTHDTESSHLVCKAY